MSAEDEAEVLELPPESPVSYPGPFKHHDVVVEGRKVPFVTAKPLDGGRVDLWLDQRYALGLSAEEAERFVPFLANALAVALGYTSHPNTGRDGPNPRHPFPRVTALYADGL
jgi:hypothetical protein